MTRDALDKGSQVVVYLPYGGTFDAVVNAKTKIASGLDVAESQVYFTRDKQSERRHTLRVLDTDPLAEPAGRTPLLDLKQRSIWRKFPFGLDQFGRRVAFCLLWISLLIGAQPRRGKTFAGRTLALFAALDPYVQHHADRREIVEGLAAAASTWLTGSCRARTRPRTATRWTRPSKRCTRSSGTSSTSTTSSSCCPWPTAPRGSSPRSCTGAPTCTYGC